MSNLVAVALCLALGLLLQRLRTFPAADAAKGLNAYAIHVALPALVLVQVSRLDVSPALLIPALTPWVLLALMVPVVIAAARAFGWSRATMAALLLLVPLGNTSFAGLPLVEAWLGSEALPFAILYDQLGSFLTLATWGTLITVRFGARSPDSPPPSPAAVARRVATFPPFLALVLALTLNATTGGEPPELMTDSLDILAKSLVPTVLVAVGLNWRLRLPGADVAPFAVALGLKLAVMPLIAAAGLAALGLHGLAADTSVLEAGMGPMITASALATGAGIRPDLAAAVTGYGTLLSLATTGLLARFVL